MTHSEFKKHILYLYNSVNYEYTRVREMDQYDIYKDVCIHANKIKKKTYEEIVYDIEEDTYHIWYKTILVNNRLLLCKDEDKLEILLGIGDIIIIENYNEIEW